jgi:ATP-binding cassette subfamily C protein
MNQNLRRFLLLLEPGTKPKLAGLFLLMLIGGGLEMIGLGLILPFLQLVLDPSRLSALPLAGTMLQPYLPSDPSQLLKPACLLLLAFYAIKNLFLAIINWTNFRFTFWSEARLQQRLMARYLTVPFEDVAMRNSAELIRTISLSTKLVFKSVMISVLGLTMEAVLSVFAVTTLLLIEPVGALTVAALLGGLVLLMYLPLRRYLTYWGAIIQHTGGDLLKALQQALGIQKEARVAGREAYFLDSFAQCTRRNAKAFTSLLALQQTPRYASEVIVLGALLLYILSAATAKADVSQTLPVLGVFGVAALRLLPSANRIIMHLGNIREGKAAIDLVYQDLFQPAEAKNAPPANLLDDVSFTSELSLSDVSYRYPQGDSDALKHISLSIPKGSAVALVGASGAGKSTLADLLLGLLRPTAGTILADGKPFDISNIAWRRRLGYVPQHIFLLDDSIRRNIAFGIPDESIDETAVRRAVDMAGLRKVIAELPDQLETVVGERGARLSGGQRQRIGIARALYHQPDLMVFDEATSALDGGTERDVIDAIDSLRGEKTLLVIAHRMTTVQHCDNIILMDKGRIVDQGRYQDLLTRSADFQRLAGSAVA